MKPIKPGDTPFNTSNAILAYCLHLAGVPWDKPTHPARVLYSPEIMEKFRNGSGQPFYQGWEFQKAVEHAHKTGRRGHVEYVFQRTPRLSRLLKAYRDQVADLDNKDGYLHELVSDLASQLTKLEPDIAMVRMACIFLQKRMDFMELWKHQVPLMVIPNAGRVRRSRETIQTEDGPREADVVTTPGMKIVSINARKETREHLGI